jgi:putative FmdB family regulatory protein
MSHHQPSRAMPIYEYTCQGCQHDFEALVRGGERVECPDCGSTKLEKRFSVPAAHTSGGNLPIAGESCGKPSCCMGRCDLG